MENIVYSEDSLQEKLLRRLQVIEASAKNQKIEAEKCKEEIHRLLQEAEMLVEDFRSSNSPSDDSFLQISGKLDSIKNILVLAISKTSEEEHDRGQENARDNILTSHVDKKLRSIVNFTRIEEEEFMKMMKYNNEVNEYVYQIKLSGLDLMDLRRDRFSIFKNKSLELSGLETELEINTLKLEDIKSILGITMDERSPDLPSEEPNEVQKVTTTSISKTGEDQQDKDSCQGLLTFEEERQEQKISVKLAAMREFQLKLIKEELGSYSSSLNVGAYPDYNVWYEGGRPDRFWLRVETWALQKLNSCIKKSAKRLSRAEEGDLVVAWFPEDGEVYRAKVKAVRQNKYHVLYLDYGNEAKDLTADCLYAWDPLYEMIHPQAHLCSFYEFPTAGEFSKRPELFNAAMRSLLAMQMTIELKVSPRISFEALLSNFGEEVELVVSLNTGNGIDVTIALLSFLDKKYRASPPPIILPEGLQDGKLDNLMSPNAIIKVADWLEKNREDLEIEDVIWKKGDEKERFQEVQDSKLSVL